MTTDEMLAMSKAFADIIRQSMAPLTERIVELEAQVRGLKQAPPPEPSPPAQVTAEQVRAALEPVREELRGERGEGATLEQIQTVLRGMVEDLRGAPGEPGANATPEMVRSVVDGMVEDLRGPPGEPGANAVVEYDEVLRAVEEVHERQTAKWALDFERRAQEALERAVSRLPTPKDGVDGFGLEDLQCEFDGERRLTLRFVRGDLRREAVLVLPSLVDRGIYSAERAYGVADGVTWAGSYWIAKRAVAPGEKPGVGDAWRLAVKKGRDGRDATPASLDPRQR